MEWAKEEIDMALKMKAAGIGYSEIADKLNRSMWGVRAFIVRAKMTERERYEADREALQRRSMRRALGTVSHTVQHRQPMTQQSLRALAERDHALALGPRDLTAAFCGDPLPGRSALDLRMRG